jgi:hypothetical protein
VRRLGCRVTARGARAATEQGWTVIAKDDNALGYVEASALAQMQ